jgi:hypothetical protein
MLKPAGVYWRIRSRAVLPYFSSAMEAEERLDMPVCTSCVIGLKQ